MRFAVILGVVFSLCGTPALAQQQGMSPAEAANQVIMVITQLSQLASTQQHQIEAMQKQIADLQKQLEEARKPQVPLPHAQ